MHLYHLLQRIGLIPYSREDIDKYYIYKDILKKHKEHKQHQVETDSSSYESKDLIKNSQNPK